MSIRTDFLFCPEITRGWLQVHPKCHLSPTVNGATIQRVVFMNSDEGVRGPNIEDSKRVWVYGETVEVLATRMFIG